MVRCGSPGENKGYFNSHRRSWNASGDIGGQSENRNNMSTTDGGNRKGMGHANTSPARRRRATFDALASPRKRHHVPETSPPRFSKSLPVHHISDRPSNGLPRNRLQGKTLTKKQQRRGRKRVPFLFSQDEVSMDLDIPVQSTSSVTLDDVPMADDAFTQTVPPSVATSFSTPPRRQPNVQIPYPSPVSPLRFSSSTGPAKTTATAIEDVEMDECTTLASSNTKPRSDENQMQIDRTVTMHQLECLILQLRHELHRSTSERNTTVSYLREQINVLANCLRGLPEIAAASMDLARACDTILTNLNGIVWVINSSGHSGPGIAYQGLQPASSGL